jgi:hypothetical protein
MDSAPITTSESGIGFYSTVTAIAVVVLILVLAFLGWTMSKQTAQNEFPKIQTTCPDFWGIDNSGEKPLCVRPSNNQLNYGNKDTLSGTPEGAITNGKFDFTNAGWSAVGSAVCGKKKWADSNGIRWDSVTNYNNC